MFVKIGPYQHRWRSTIYAEYMNKKYDHNWNDSNNFFEHFLDKLETFLQFVYNVTINKILDKRDYQKVKVRIDDYDLWGMDNTLAHIISPMIDRLKKTKRGSAWVDDSDVPESLHNKEALDYQNHPDHDALIQKRWNYVLEEISWAFRQKTRESWEEDYYEFEKSSGSAWAPKYKRCDAEGLKAHQARMSNGFRLFGVYYENFWD